MTTIKRVAQHQTPTMIRDREEFDASNMTGRVESGGVWDSGYLAGRDLDALRRDAASIDYVVRSYSTPIAWHTTEGEWHVVAQRFSMTTGSKHQSRLYLIPHAAHHAHVVLIGRGQGWRVLCMTCGKPVDSTVHTTRRSAEDHAHYHRLNGDR